MQRAVGYNSGTWERELSEEGGTVVSSSFFSDPCNLGNGDGPHYKYRNSGWDFLFNKWLCYTGSPFLDSLLGFTSKSIIQVLQFIPRLQRRNQSYKRWITYPSQWMPRELEYRPRLVLVQVLMISLTMVWSVWSLQQIFREAQRELGKCRCLSLSLTYDMVLEVRPEEGAVHFNKHLRGSCVLWSIRSVSRCRKW